MNLTSILWDYDTNDWSAGTTETVQQVQASYDEFIQMGTNGSMTTHGNIVLTHEIANVTMSLALTNLPNIMKNYKHVINVATCQNITYPYMERTVAFRTFDEYLSQNTSAAGAASSIVGSNTNGAVTATGNAATQSSATSGASIVRAVSPVFLLPLLLVLFWFAFRIDFLTTRFNFWHSFVVDAYYLLLFIQ